MNPHSAHVMPTAATAGGAGGGAMRSVPQTLQNRASSGFSALQFEQIFAIPSLCLLIETTIPWFMGRGKPRAGFAGTIDRSEAAPQPGGQSRRTVSMRVSEVGRGI